MTHRAAFVWFVYAFAALARHRRARDAPGHPRRPGRSLIGPTMIGYMVAMALVPLAARRPLRVTEAQAALGISKTDPRRDRPRR